MKKLSLVAFLLIAIIFSSNAQVPQAICYQALAKDELGANLLDQQISLRISILGGGTSGTEIWVERQDPFTDAYGVFSIEVGQGQYISGSQTDFSDIDWGNNTFWLRIEMDPTGGSNFELMGTSQIISVPYALYAEASEKANHAQTADVAINAQTAAFADEAGNAQTSDTALVAFSVIGDNDTDALNEIQTLSTQNGALFLQNPDGSLSGNGISIDTSTTNELQNMTFQNGALYLQNPDGTLNGNGLTVDTSDTNELQTLSFDGERITLSNGNSIEVFSSEQPFSAPSASYDLPQGIIGNHRAIYEGPFQVPPGQNFWVTAAGPTIQMRLNNNLLTHFTSPNMPVFGENQIIENCRCTGVLIGSSPQIEPIVLNFDTSNPTYTVPDGKILFVKSGLKNDEIGWLVVDGNPMEFVRSNFTRGTRIITIPPNTTVQPLSSQPNLLLTGYLIDEN